MRKVKYCHEVIHPHEKTRNKERNKERNKKKTA